MCIGMVFHNILNILFYRKISDCIFAKWIYFLKENNQLAKD